MTAHLVRSRARVKGASVRTAIDDHESPRPTAQTRRGTEAQRRRAVRKAGHRYRSRPPALRQVAERGSGVGSDEVGDAWRDLGLPPRTAEHPVVADALLVVVLAASFGD